MKRLIVRGGNALRGSVSVGGSKNAALPILAATLLCEEPCIVGNLPAIRDVERMLTILIHMGCVVERLDRATYRIDARHAIISSTPDPLTEDLRASSYLLGAGLGRFGEGRIGKIGGCDFGGRPIDQHIKAFAALGASVHLSEEEISVSASHIIGACVDFDTVSVGATVNAMLAAVRAKGETVLYHAACEPHIVDLANFLNRCGADIRGAGTGVIRIFGVPRLGGCSYGIIPDMIEAGTYLLAAAATRGAVAAKGISPEQLRPLCEKLRQMGADVDCEENVVYAFAASPLRGVSVATQPYPGFPTDLQPQMVAALACAQGVSCVRENVWRKRFQYVDQLHKMGAQIRVFDNRATVVGGALLGAEMTVPDLRAGAALLIAACAAEGQSILRSVEPITRGYEDILFKMHALGADIHAED